MVDVLLEVVVDTLKSIPFLFITFLLMEYFEHKISNISIIKKANKYGPILGSLFGIIPQCGVSLAATNFYATRMITLGTLISIYLSTSDEMLPLLIAGDIKVGLIVKILLIKFFVGMIVGLIIDLIIKPKLDGKSTKDFCIDEHCHCEDGILKSALIHTLKITLYILVFTFILNTIIFYFGEENIKMAIANNNIFGPFIASLIGLIPNCAASVILTEMYISNLSSLGFTIAGLLTGSGIGLLVLFKVNQNLKENIKIVSILYFVGVIVGIIVDLLF